MRSTDFADLREMLVNCIEENRDTLVLELKMETLNDWLGAEQEQDTIGRLNQLENELLQVGQSL